MNHPFGMSLEWKHQTLGAHKVENHLHDMIQYATVSSLCWQPAPCHSERSFVATQMRIWRLWHSPMGTCS